MKLNKLVDELQVIKDPELSSMYVSESTLGVCRYGIVRKGYVVSDPGKSVMIKTINLEKLKGKSHEIMQEIVLMKKAKHAGVAKTLHIFKDVDNIYVVREFPDGTNLRKLVQSGFSIGSQNCSKIIKQVLKIANHLNSLSVCYRDIKLDNLILSPDGTKVHLIDIGLSSCFNKLEDLRDNLKAPNNLSPEGLQGKFKIGLESWSIGVLSYYFLVGQFPFTGKSMTELFHQI